jgi:hypothetical protein
MKFALAILVLIVFVLSFVADYKWRKWMNKRHANHDSPQPPGQDYPHQTL